jgi:septum site-determining protein MinD
VNKVIVVTSGKGGVGKTTTGANFATGLALRGYKTVVIDFDIGLRNLDLVMGCERRVVYDFVNVLHGEAKLKQALIRDKNCELLDVLPASQTRDKEALTKEGVGQVLDQLRLEYDYIVCDSPAGIERGAIMALYFADEAIIVTNPEVSAVRDSDRILGILAAKSKRAEDGDGERVIEHLVITRYVPQRAQIGEMLGIRDICDLLGIPLLGVIPESETVLQASNMGVPVIHNEKSPSGQAYQDMVDRFLGEERPLRFIKPAKKGFFTRIFGT